MDYGFALAAVKMALDKLKTALRDAAATSHESDGRLGSFRPHMEVLKLSMEAMAEVVGDAETRLITDWEALQHRVTCLYDDYFILLEDAAYDIWDMVDEFQANQLKPVTEVHRYRHCLPIASARKGRSIASWMLKAKHDVDGLLQLVLESNRQVFSKKSNRHVFVDRKSTSEVRRDVDEGKLEQPAVDDAHPPVTPPLAVAGNNNNNQEYMYIVGRDQDKLKIMNTILLSAERGVFIIAIFGEGGTGKTTLAKLVFSDTTVIRDYAHAWVTVGCTFDLKKIGNCILSQLSNEGNHQDYSNNLEQIMKRFDNLLLHGNSKLLLVLDNVRVSEDRCDMEGLRRMLGAGKEGNSKVIVMVTTRHAYVAARGADTTYALEPLNDVDSWHLLKRKLGSATIADDDARRDLLSDCCRGRPLAIHAIGSTLRSKSCEEIRSVLTSGMPEWADYDYAAAALQAAYLCMPLNLRLCFACCAMFPQGHNILKDDLIHHWTALQLIEPSSDRLSTTQLANKYIGKLLDMSFLQRTMQPSVGTRSLRAVYVREKKRLFTMNNLVNDLVRNVLGGMLVVVDGRNMATLSLSFLNSSRIGPFAFVSNLNTTLENLTSILPAADRILSLRFVGCSNMKISDGAFSSAKKLRLLDLRGCLDDDFLDNAWPDSGTPPPTKQPLRRSSLGKLPESIGQLKHLRYLNAPAIQDRVLPLSIINGLSRSLWYLSLRCSRQLTDLTEAFGTMKSLKHLDLSGCSGLKSLPESLGGCSLLHLDLSGCTGLKALPRSVREFGSDLRHLDLSGCSGLKSLPESFGACWRSLQHLDLSGCTGLKTLPQSVRAGGSSSNLRHLDMSGCSCLQGITEALSVCTNLRYLNLSHRCGYSVEDWFHLKGLNVVLPKLKELQFLGISSCLDPICYAMPAEESNKYVNCIANLDKLEHLDMSQNKFLRHLPENIGALKELRTLDLSMCFRLESLQGIGEVTELRVLDISGCPQLNPLPEDTQQQLAKLPFLQSRECLTSITSPRQGQAAGSQEEPGANQAQECASTSQDAACQPHMDPSSSKPEITEIPENH